MGAISKLKEKQNRLSNSINQHNIELENIVKNQKSEESKLIKIKNNTAQAQKSLDSINNKITESKEELDNLVLIQKHLKNGQS